ncbi:MAG: VOC family protein [Deltaproteobacteria bacterium]|nr:VOC family protein [Deltaproteobacteria bacterium]
MRLETNPFDAPPWLQVLGVIEHTRRRAAAEDYCRVELDHIDLAVSDVARCREFYLRVLAPFGYRLVRDFGDEAAGLGTAEYAALALVRRRGTVHPAHLAFRVATRGGVDALYRAALAAGARNNGAPGLRTQYHPSYYAAFVHDPESNNLKFVCHEDEALG